MWHKNVPMSPRGRAGIVAAWLQWAIVPAQAAELSPDAQRLREYLRLDTRNPPGNQRSAADFLGDLLRREGVSTSHLVNAAGRSILYARLPAADPAAGTLVLMHHTDVVAPGPGWSRDPLAAELVEGRLYGRGALDDKSLGIAQLAAFLELHRSGRPLRRHVVLLAVPDEETGGVQGTGWLLEHHPEIFDGVEAVLNEGGANRVIAGRLLWWGIEVAQKRALWLEVTASGRAGHGSGLQPYSAAHQLIAALGRVLARPPRWRVTPAIRDFLAAVAPLHNDQWRVLLRDIDAVIAPEGPRQPLLPGMANLFLDSVQVTVLEAGSQINSIPAEARAQLDIRLLPDTDDEAFLNEIRELLGQQIDVKVLLRTPPSAPSPVSTSVYRELAAALGREGPVAPVAINGLTDSRYFRQRGIAAYGFFPFALAGDELQGIHGPDENIPLGEFELGVERMKRVVRALAGEQP